MHLCTPQQKLLADATADAAQAAGDDGGLPAKIPYFGIQCDAGSINIEGKRQPLRRGKTTLRQKSIEAEILPPHFGAHGFDPQ